MSEQDWVLTEAKNLEPTVRTTNDSGKWNRFGQNELASLSDNIMVQINVNSKHLRLNFLSGMLYDSWDLMKGSN